MGRLKGLTISAGGLVLIVSGIGMFVLLGGLKRMILG